MAIALIRAVPRQRAGHGTRRQQRRLPAAAGRGRGDDEATLNLRHRRRALFRPPVWCGGGITGMTAAAVVCCCSVAISLSSCCVQETRPCRTLKKIKGQRTAVSVLPPCSSLCSLPFSSPTPTNGGMVWRVYIYTTSTAFVSALWVPPSLYGCVFGLLVNTRNK